MDTVLSIIDENKEKLSDGDYLKLCDAMKKIYDTKEKTETKIETVYVERFTNDIISNRRVYEIRGPNRKRGILFSHRP